MGSPQRYLQHCLTTNWYKAKASDVTLDPLICYYLAYHIILLSFLPVPEVLQAKSLISSSFGGLPCCGAVSVSQPWSVPALSPKNVMLARYQILESFIG